MPGSGVAVIWAKLFLGTLETLFDCPAQAGGAGQFRQGCSGSREGQVVGTLRGIAPAATDQQPALKAGIDRPRQSDPRSVIQAWTFRPLASGVPRPSLGRQRIGQRQGISLFQAFIRQQAQRMIGSGRQHVGLLTCFEHAADAGVCPIECIRQHERTGCAASSAAAIILAAIAGLV